MNSIRRTSLPYRADIDGLRAVAIIAVVLFHMFPLKIKGGFVGVDVFFVISGYLIGSKILDKFKLGEFSFSDFFTRRVVRILPLLLLILFVNLCIGYFLLLPIEFESLGKHVAGATVFISNFILMKESGYFDIQADLKPLLHLWSLGIEEQFYVFLPFLTLLFSKKSRIKTLIVLFAVVGFSFSYNLFEVYKNADVAFYSPFSRIWELMLGVALSRVGALKSKVSGLESYLSTFGLALIVFSIYFLDKGKVFPGFWALVPVFGTCLIIYSGQEAWVNRSVLSFSPVVFIGKISYSLYLWHWSLLSYCHIVLGQKLEIFHIIIAIILSFALSIITYFLIEQKIGRLSELGRKRVFRVTAIALIIMGVLGITVKNAKIAPFNSSIELKKISQAAGEWDFPGRLERLEFSSGKFYWKIGNGPKKTLLIGDSHAEQYYPRISYLTDIDPNITVYFVTHGGCPPIENIISPNPSKKDCGDVFKNGFELAKSEKVTNVIFAATWISYLEGNLEFYYLSDSDVKEKISVHSDGYFKSLASLKNTIENLKKENIKVTLLSNNLESPFLNPKEMLERRFQIPSISVKPQAISRSAFEKEHEEVLTDLEKVANETRSNLINPLDALCKEDICNVVDSNGEPIYKDDNHIRPSFMKERVDYLDKIIMLNEVEK